MGKGESWDEGHRKLIISLNIFYPGLKSIIIRLKESEEKDYQVTKVTDILTTDKFNVTKVKIEGVNNETKYGYDSESDVAYYVLEGEGDCVIDGKAHHLKKGDLVFYPKGTRYKHLSGLTLLAIACPPFDREKRVYVKVDESQD
jgi:mannose-6-phosphate isomerase-like protein (cupin superfamily)